MGGGGGIGTGFVCSRGKGGGLGWVWGGEVGSCGCSTEGGSRDGMESLLLNIEKIPERLFTLTSYDSAENHILTFMESSLCI